MIIRIPFRNCTIDSMSVLPFFWYALLLPVAAKLEIISLGNPFNDSARNHFNLLGHSGISKDALQITPDTSNVEAFLVNKSGRVIYKKPYRIYEPIYHPAPSNETLVSSDRTKKVISFNSSFVFNIYPVQNRTVGEGLAFVIFPDPDSIPDNSHGGFLGLTNSSLDGNPKNQFVAVEFDTFKQSYDPDANHVGININSVRSIASRSLSELNITLAPHQYDGVKYLARVQYSERLRRIEVYLSEWTKPRPRVPLLNATIDLSTVLAERSYFGFSASTGTLFELNCILSWNLTVEILPEKISPNHVDLFLKIGLPILSVILLVLSCFGFWAYRRRGREEQRVTQELRNLTRTLIEYDYSVLDIATRNFDDQNKLGQGGYGIVYRGEIAKENATVAVKKFTGDSMQEDFIDELTMINRFSHRNLVRLRGWCHNRGKLLLVYDFMENRSLDNHLYGEPPAPPLAWRHRVQILAGVASGLNYLHNFYDQTVLHRDIKPSNIMLDGDFNARLRDFGLAKVIENERNSYGESGRPGLAGTPGYIAPECVTTLTTSLESDVFAFGIVILEVVCGRKPQIQIDGFRILANWVWNLHERSNILGAVDSRLGEEYDKDEAKKLLTLGLACSNPIPEDRPKITTVSQVISGSAPPPEIPPMRPASTRLPDLSELYDENRNITQYITAKTSYSSSSSYPSHRVHEQEKYSGTAESLSLPLR